MVIHWFGPTQAPTHSKIEAISSRTVKQLSAGLRLAFLTAVAMVPAGLHSQTPTCPAESPSGPYSIQSDYIYGYPAVALEATRAIQTAVSDNSQSGQAPINQFALQTALSTPADHLVIRPNADTLYSTAWLDLANEPIILHVPDMAGRYYLMPMLDAYSNEFASIGSRTTGEKEGDYAVVGPRWQGTLPQNLAGIIHAPTNTVWLIGRTLADGPSDVNAAVTMAKQYALVPLSAYSQFLETGTFIPPVGVPFSAPSDDFNSFPVTNSPGFSEPKFFDVLARYAIENPPPPNQFVQATASVGSGLLNQGQMNDSVQNQAVAEMTCELRRTATVENGWSFHLNIGTYATNYLLRAAVAQYGLGANIPADAVYLNAGADSTGTQFNGTNSYVIHFAPGQIPPENGFWSITVYGSDGFLVDNPINRYVVGSETGLQTNPDGSVDIFLQSAPPNALLSNWLPIPSDIFSLTLRIFWPKKAVLDQTWIPPTIQKTSQP